MHEDLNIPVLLEQNGRMTHYIKEIERWVELIKPEDKPDKTAFAVEQIKRCVYHSRLKPHIDKCDFTDF